MGRVRARYRSSTWTSCNRSITAPRFADDFEADSFSDADAFLGTQGDVWDTQWDMFLALIGAITAPLLLSGLHDRQLTWASPVYRLPQCILQTFY
jgi:hypothetical protein